MTNEDARARAVLILDIVSVDNGPHKEENIRLLVSALLHAYQEGMVDGLEKAIERLSEVTK